MSAVAAAPPESVDRLIEQGFARARVTLAEGGAGQERLDRITHLIADSMQTEVCSIYLFRDAAESYWYNLVGREPSLCVVCRPGNDIELEPFAVTANYDEAGAYMEADDTVFSAPLPPEARVISAPASLNA